jgi:hypothetical protein
VAEEKAKNQAEEVNKRRVLEMRLKLAAHEQKRVSAAAAALEAVDAAADGGIMDTLEFQQLTVAAARRSGVAAAGNRSTVRLHPLAGRPQQTAGEPSAAGGQSRLQQSLVWPQGTR